MPLVQDVTSFSTEVIFTTETKKGNSRKNFFSGGVDMRVNAEPITTVHLEVRGAVLLSGAFGGTVSSDCLAYACEIVRGTGIVITLEKKHARRLWPYAVSGEAPADRSKAQAKYLAAIEHQLAMAVQERRELEQTLAARSAAPTWNLCCRVCPGSAGVPAAVASAAAAGTSTPSSKPILSQQRARSPAADAPSSPGEMVSADEKEEPILLDEFPVEVLQRIMNFVLDQVLPQSNRAETAIQLGSVCHGFHHALVACAEDGDAQEWMSCLLCATDLRIAEGELADGLPFSPRVAFSRCKGNSCKGYVCSDCAEELWSLHCCGRTFCEDCHDDEDLFLCDSCETLQCKRDECNDTERHCVDCEQDLCEQCQPDQWPCSGCCEFTCTDCGESLYCDHCSNSMCEDCTDDWEECEQCGSWVCADCAPVAPCGHAVCPYRSYHCDSCATESCRSCIRADGGGRQLCPHCI